MTIRHKLQISSLFYVLFAVAIGLVLLLQTQYSRQAHRMMKSNYEIVRSVFDLAILTDDYLAHPYEQRPLVQWRLKHEMLNNVLATSEVLSQYQNALLDVLKTSNKDLAATFDQIIEKGAASGPLSSQSRKDPALDRLVGLLSNRLQVMVSDASLLYQLSQQAVTDSQQKTYTAIAVFALLMVIIMVINLLTLNSAVLKPLNELAEGVNTIGAGNLDYRLPVRGKDELGTLAVLFNQMTANLQDSRSKLETEIQERQMAEEALARHATELARSNEDLEQFAYIASHDLQEPLRNATNCIQLLERRYKGKLDKDADQFINYAVQSIVRMKDLIDDLLAYSRVGTKEKKYVATDCNSIVENALDNLDSTLKETGAVVAYDNLPIVAADPVLLTQVFQNLISNGIKFRNERRPEVQVSAELSDDEWVFSVADNGIGIADEYLDKIFVIFKRLHARAEYPGAGLGLAIVKKVIERHGGRVWVDSFVGTGSTFHFSLPFMELNGET